MRPGSMEANVGQLGCACGRAWASLPPCWGGGDCARVADERCVALFVAWCDAVLSMFWRTGCRVARRCTPCADSPPSTCISTSSVLTSASAVRPQSLAATAAVVIYATRSDVPVLQPVRMKHHLQTGGSVKARSDGPRNYESPVYSPPDFYATSMHFSTLRYNLWCTRTCCTR